MNLQTEISKILTKEYKMVDLEAVDAILALIKKHEKEVIGEIKDDFVKLAIVGAEDPDVQKGLMLYARFLDYLAKLKNPNGPKEVEK